MALKDQISELITPALHQAGYFLEDVNIVSPGQHRIVTVIVDGESGLNLDQVTVASKLVSELLDEAPFMGETPFTLEVTSPGIDRPLTKPRHWRKNFDRLVKITMTSGKDIQGRIGETTEANVLVGDQKVSFEDIKRAVLEIEFK